MTVSYIKLDEAKRLRDSGDRVISQTLSAPRITTSYEPQIWEDNSIDERIMHYQDLGALGKTIYKPSREATQSLILSFESIIRRHGYLAFPSKHDDWSKRISHRITELFLRTLRDKGFLIARPIQVSKRANVYDASPALISAIPPLPPGETEGKLKSDRPWQSLVIKPSPSLEEAGVLRSLRSEIDGATAEVAELNRWYSTEADRIEGVDDLRFHRVFHHNLTLGGRLYGQFTSMDRELHRPLVKIDGEETEEADLNGSYLSFFLLLSGWDELPADPYQHDKLANYDRRLVKATMLRLFGKGSWWKKHLSNDLYKNSSAYGYPDGLPKYKGFRNDIIETYPCLDVLNDKWITHRIDNFESRALLNTLKWLKAQGEIGLPIHDGIRVRRNIKEATEAEFRRQRKLTCDGD